VTLRLEAEIRAAEGECRDRLWYARHVSLMAKDDGSAYRLDILDPSSSSADRIEAKYGLETLELGADAIARLESRLAALRWVLGDEWENLDT